VGSAEKRTTSSKRKRECSNSNEDRSKKKGLEGRVQGGKKAVPKKKVSKDNLTDQRGQ